MRVLKRALSGFVVVVSLALFWRFLGLTFDSLWLDEGYQSLVDAYGRPLPDFFQVPKEPFIYQPPAPASPSEMLQNFRSVDPLTPPLYQLLLNRWIALFGGTDFALRSLSILISTGALTAIYWSTFILFGARAALVTGLVQAFSPHDVYYGQEIRMYGLVELAATVACASLIIYLVRGAAGRGKVLLLALHCGGCWALINSHYTGLFVVLYCGMLGTLFILARRSWRLLFELGLSWIMVGVLWLPWLPMFFQSAKLRTASFYVARQPSLLWPIYALLIKIPSNWVMFLSGKQVVAYAAPLYVLSPIMVAVAFLSRTRTRLNGALFQRRATQHSCLAFYSVLGWLVIPALVLWLLDVSENHKVIEMSRYTIATAPALYILIGAGLSMVNWRRKFVPIVFALYLLFAAVNNVAHATAFHQRQPWREMALYVETHAPRENLLLVSQYYFIPCLDRYLKIPFRQVGVSSVTTPAQMEQILDGVSGFSLVTAQEGDQVLKVISPRYRAVEHKDLGHSLHFYTFSQ